MTRVMLAIPSHEIVSVSFAGDLAQLYAYSCGSLPGSVDLNMVIGTYVHDAREQLAAAAIESGASHVLWLDSDMRFPRDALMRLLAHRMDAVGINYRTRSTPGHFVAATLDGTGRVETGLDATGLEEVSALGFGLFLMRTSVLTRTLSRSGAPLFRYDWLDDGRWVGEDFAFCRRARGAGIILAVDHDLSKECAHVGQFEYRHDHAMEYAT